MEPKGKRKKRKLKEKKGMLKRGMEKGEKAEVGRGKVHSVLSMPSLAPFLHCPWTQHGADYRGLVATIFPHSSLPNLFCSRVSHQQDCWYLGVSHFSMHF